MFPWQIIFAALQQIFPGEVLFAVNCIYFILSGAKVFCKAHKEGIGIFNAGVSLHTVDLPIYLQKAMIPYNILIENHVFGVI